VGSELHLLGPRGTGDYGGTNVGCRDCRSFDECDVMPAEKLVVGVSH